MKKILTATFILSLSLLGNCFAGYDKKLPLPGTSAADEQLQYDTLMPLYFTLGTKATNCKDMKVTNTKVSRKPYNLNFKGRELIGATWEEVWTVNACSKMYDVPVKFILDETGTTYIISGKNIIAK